MFIFLSLAINYALFAVSASVVLCMEVCIYTAEINVLCVCCITCVRMMYRVTFAWEGIPVSTEVGVQENVLEFFLELCILGYLLAEHAHPEKKIPKPL